MVSINCFSEDKCHTILLKMLCFIVGCLVPRLYKTSVFYFQDGKHLACLCAVCVVLYLTWSRRFICDKAQMSLVMRKPTFCICENKDADQLRGNLEVEADQQAQILSVAFKSKDFFFFFNDY